MIEKLENRAWKVLKSENILNLGPWLNVRQELVELPSGKQIPTWFVLDFPDWINVIAITKDGDFVMEDQYRHGLGETHYELVAGVIDPGETPLQAAQRELSEETGFGGGEWQLFMTLSPNPTNHKNLRWLRYGPSPLRCLCGGQSCTGGSLLVSYNQPLCRIEMSVYTYKVYRHYGSYMG